MVVDIAITDAEEQSRSDKFVAFSGKGSRLGS